MRSMAPSSSRIRSAVERRVVAAGRLAADDDRAVRAVELGAGDGQAVVAPGGERVLGRQPVVDRDDPHAELLGQLGVGDVVHPGAAHDHRPAVQVQVGRARAPAVEHPAGHAGDGLVVACGRLLLERRQARPLGGEAGDRVGRGGRGGVAADRPGPYRSAIVVAIARASSRSPSYSSGQSMPRSVGASRGSIARCRWATSTTRRCSRRSVGDGRPLLFVVAGSLTFAGGFMLFLAATGDLLPHDSHYLGWPPTTSARSRLSHRRLHGPRPRRVRWHPARARRAVRVADALPAVARANRGHGGSGCSAALSGS